MSELDENNVTNDAPFIEAEKPAFETEPETNDVLTTTPEVSNTLPTGNPKNNKKRIGILALIAGIAACVILAVFAVPRIIETISRSNASPSERFCYAVENFFLSGAKSYEEQIADRVVADRNNCTVSMDFNITMNEMITSMLQQANPTLLANLKLNSVSGTVLSKNKGEEHNVDVILSANDTKLLSLESYYAKSDDTFIFRMPELSANYLSVPMNLAELGGSSSLPQFDFGSYQIPDIKEIKDLYTDCSKILTTEIKEVTVTNDVAIVASDITSTYDKLTATVTTAASKTIIINLIKRLYETETYKAILDAAVLSSNTQNGTSYTLEELLGNLESELSSQTNQFDLSLYVDQKNTLYGCELTTSVEGSIMSVTFLSAKDEKNGIEFAVSLDNQKLMSITATYTETKEGYQGVIKLLVSDEDSTLLTGSEVSLSMDFEKVKVVDKKNGYMTGSFYITSPQLNGMTIDVILGVTGEKQEINFNVSAASMSFVNVTASYQITNGAEIIPPATDATIYDAETQINDYATSAAMGLIGMLGTIGETIGVDFMSLIFGM